MMKTAKRSRGAALVYLSVGMVIVFAVASLAVDVGRVHLVKAEMQLAADSAARHGAAGLASGGPSQARSNAAAAASDNTADGARVVVDRNADVELGTWNAADQSFTALAGSAESSADAIRVTARRTAARGNPTPLLFARVVGMSAVDLQARAVARVTRRRPGIVGLDSISLSGNSTNSYRSSSGSYGTSSTLYRNGTVQTNGDIRLSGGAIVYGDAYVGPGKSVSLSGGSMVTGTTTQLTQPLDYPPATAGTAATVNDNANIPGTFLSAGRDLSVNSDLALPGGTYYLDDITVSGTCSLSFTGPATVYVTGTVNMGGRVTTNGDRPVNLKFIMLSTGGFSLGGGTILYADVYAPLSPFSMSGSAVLLGSVVARSVTTTGGAQIIFDEDLTVVAPTVSLVR